MAASYTYLPYADTGYFSNLVTDYLAGNPFLKDFFTWSPDADGIAEAIKHRAQYPVNREVLVNTLHKQYQHLNKHEKVEKNLGLLQQENTFTVCTAHQPNLLTGYLYFIYKIIHAIKMAEELTLLHPGKNFVPVYYMGSEDNDIEELGTFRFNNTKYVWDGDGQKGAVGQMKTKGLKPLLNELFRLFGPPGPNCDQLTEMLSEAYLKHDTIGSATQYLVNELFGRYGLIVLDPNEAAFKQAIIPIIKDDLLHHTAESIVSAEIKKLSAKYKAQAHPRAINLFYLNHQLRERIEKKDDKWIVLNTDIAWTEEAMLNELNLHPERFSPNVILRGILQESILPDVAFIGGGAEVAYWLQLRSLFNNYKVFYPAVCLRQSVLCIQPAEARLRAQLQLSVSDIFKNEDVLVKEYVTKHSSDDWQTTHEAIAFENIFEQLLQKASAIDPTLKASSEAALTKIKHQLLVLEKKMLRAEKKKMEVQLLRISKLKANLFPNNSLQERVDNFSSWFLQYGFSFFDELKDSMPSMNNEFIVIEHTL